MTKTNHTDSNLIICLCKDIARHASQLEATTQGVEQSTDRYLEFKNLLTNYYLYGTGNFETIKEELCRSMHNAGDVEKDEKNVLSVKNHILCMFECFLMLHNEVDKEKEINFESENFER